MSRSRKEMEHSAAPLVTVEFQGRFLDCPEFAAHAEGSNVGFQSEMDAVRASLTETIWQDAELEEQEPDRWRGIVDGRTVVLVYVEENVAGTWDWGRTCVLPRLRGAGWIVILSPLALAPHGEGLC